MNLKKIKEKQITKTRKEIERRDLYHRLHVAKNMIRKLDQQIPYIKEFNQKNKDSYKLVPCKKIHKAIG